MSLWLSKLSKILVAPSRFSRVVALNSFSSRSTQDLEDIYPNSSLKFDAPQKPPETKGLNFSGFIPIDSLQVTCSRSSGPGGQHVNTTSSKVDVRFEVAKASWLSEELKQRLVEQNPNALNKDGFFIVKSDKTRSQHLNLADCLDKLRKTIWESAKEPAPPSEESIERHRRLLERAARQRLAEKRVRAVVKASRRQPLGL
ncbi:unnamed protein product [Notodromas monacha]|uniref:Large ribosomal subunit protein mL62 n=1 Tax=Notodromas monacha TaxID=399045 RepID=A0A7R9GAA4_9CRUS|nr:unnamed protein product [Notodromas monacha]CAG0913492.1 unnamed protein product [Notodromas monacha]